MPAERIGPYRIGQRLGAGGMGEVYKAYDERLERWVALKRVSSEKSFDTAHRERFRREARASARLNHPAIVQVYDLVETEDGDCIIMELVEGGSLADLLRRGPLELAQALLLALEIAEALAEAHSHGIVHRDLKAENVIVTPEGHAKVLDFGISKRLDEAESRLTADGSLLGTCRTMAPEQAKGLQVDHRADLFSFGVLLYEMLVARSPFLASSAAVTIHRVCTERHISVRTHDSLIPEALSQLIDQLLEKRPEDRPQTARTVVATLATFSPGLLPTPPGLAEPQTGETTPLLEARPAVSAERRQVTVLSCGLVHPDGTALDAEEILHEMPALRAGAAGLVQRFEGHLVQASGHDCLAYFGDVQAHEDDARRAVYTALELVRGTGRPFAGAKLAVRAGIHTGPMVVTRQPAARGDSFFLGETPGVANLVQSAAAPRAVLVSQSTLRLTEGYFDCEELVPLAVPGAGPPLLLYRVLSDRGAHGRVEAAGSLTPLVGREVELALLVERWSLAHEGRGQVVLVNGEAGLGKSRLLRELHQRVAGAAQWLAGYGSPFHRGSVLYPILQWLDQLIGSDPADAAEARLRRLEETVASSGLPLPETVPPLAALLSLPMDNRYSAPPALSPEAQRRKTLDAILSLLLAAAERQPLLLVVEDLHWVDPSTVELLGLLIGHAEASALLLVMTSRPEFQSPWQHRSSVTHLPLSSLTRAQAGVMIESLTADRRGVPIDLHNQIVARTDGVPLFIEEMTKMVLDAAAEAADRGDTGDLRPSREIPDTLEGWLTARLDRLGTAKEVAQLAAVLGREFSHELLRAAAPWSEEILQRELERLVEAELLYRRELPLRLRYQFKHALLQDAAYASLLKRDRKRHHQRVAEALEGHFPEIVARQPELLAHHYTAADMPGRALPFWQRAGENAIQASAYPEASGHLQRALALLAEVPENGERVQQEIALQLALGMALAATRTFSTPEVQHAFQRAWELCGEVGQTPQVFTTLRGLFIHRLISGDMHGGLEMAERLHEMARQEGPGLLRVSHQGLGFVLLCRGELTRARTHLEEAISLFESTDSSVDLSLPGSGNLLLEAMANLSWALWLLGYPDQALRQSREAVAQARELQALFSRCFVVYFASEIHAYRREPKEVLAQIEELASLATEQGYPHFVSVAVFLRGWAESALGEVTPAFERMREGIEGRLALGALAGVPNHLTLLAERCLQADRIPEGLAAVDRALEISSSGGQHLFDAELWRLKGELLRRNGSPDSAAEEMFGQALAVARRQSARSLELRAAMSLARLWCRRGKKAEARDLLAPVFEWFTEGFDTRDLQEARSLLAELA